MLSYPLVSSLGLSDASLKADSGSTVKRPIPTPEHSVLFQEKALNFFGHSVILLE